MPATAGHASQPSPQIEEQVVDLIPALRAFARTFTSASFEADDLVQETLLRALRSIHQFAPGTSLKSWLFTIMPLYVLGLMGVTRRVSQFEDPSLQIWFVIAAFGAFLIALGILSMLVQIVVSFIRREELRDTTGDPWDARTLEWSTSSPPPDYNFAFTPVVHDQDSWWDM